MIVKGIEGKQFSFHLEFVINDKNVIRISFSNIFKEQKSCSGTSIQIPLTLEPVWTILHIQGFNILHDAGIFSSSSTDKKFFLRSVQMCSNIWIKGIYTSDIAYNVQSFPKEVHLKSKSKEQWH